MLKARIVSVFLLAGFVIAVRAQHRVDMRNTHERVLCVVPMIGAGTPEDPRRPMFAPIPGAKTGDDRPGIIAFSYQLTDDGQHAIVEFVARDREGLREILDARGRSDVKVFERGRHKRDDIEREFRKHKRDVDLDRFGVSVP